MYLTNQFSIPSSIDKAWDTLLSVTEIVDCVPGAKLTEVVSETSWKGSLDVSLDGRIESVGQGGSGGN